MVNLTIDNQPVSVPEGTTVLEAAKQANAKIPTLCYLHLEKSGFLNNVASCRICVVEVKAAETYPHHAPLRLPRA
jgi:NADH dehydrogenase/NADH:ubiquinone oxidoreductase subunit G